MPDNTNSIPPQQYYDEDEINLLDLLIILAKHKKLIIGGTLGAGIVMAIISLLMTPIYQAETKIYIPQSSPSISSQLLSQLGPMAGLAGGAAKSPNELYIEVLKSRPVCDRIIDRFGLMKVYDRKGRDGARQTLLGNIKTKQDIKSGVITLGIQDSDPKRAAAMANAFVEEFRNVNKSMALTEASQRRVFFEEQLKDAKESLTKAEAAMQSFQEKTGAVKIDAQAEAVIGGIAQLRAQIAAKEVQLRVIRTYTTSQNPDTKLAEQELSGMREQVQRLESKNSGDSAIVPTGNLPSTGTEYLRRMRELKFNETLYELLVSQFQAAKLDEARDAITVQIIEKAEPPVGKIKPKRSKMIIIIMMLGFVVFCMISYLINFKESAQQDPEYRARVDLLKRYTVFNHKQLDQSHNKE